jgi:DtxR family manganese transport transcriptional regulator
MPKARPANVHARIRRDHTLETAEDYVEAIEDSIAERGLCRVTDLAERFAVSHVTVNRTVARLRRDGYAQSEPYGPITLTRKGQKLAQASRRRHQIVLEFLRRLGVSDTTAEADAEGIEHHVSDETLAAMQAYCEEATAVENAGADVG